MDDEYRSTVYTWFDRCGIISNIRTHLRHHLVNALKNKELSLKKKSNIARPVKQYVYDLLIAEYLFNLNYAYSLSVFASEAPLLINFYNDVPKCSTDKGTSTKHKLQNDYICHTLETLGIQPDSSIGRRVIQEYTEGNVPLLLCILKCIASFSFHTKSNDEGNKHLCNNYTQTENCEVSSDSSIAKLMIAKDKLFKQKELFDGELRKREVILTEQAIQVDEKLVSLNEKLHEIQELMEIVNAKEVQLNKDEKIYKERILQKEIELSMKENLLLQESNRLDKEKDSYRKFENDLKKLQEELIKVQKELPKDGKSSEVSVKDVYVQADIDSIPMKSNDTKMFDKEKQELNNLIQEQQLRIEQLTLRAVQLSRQLEEVNLFKSTPMKVQLPIPENLNSRTIVSESSSTEDILQDARMRLKRLEEESMKAEEYYYKCISTSPL